MLRSSGLKTKHGKTKLTLGLLSWFAETDENED